MSDSYEPADPVWRAALPPQRKLWLAYELDSRTPDNFVPLAMRYEGLVPFHALHQALGQVIRRHRVLRWQFRITRNGLEFTERTWAPPAISLADAAGAGPVRTRTLVQAFLTRPFEITNYPLFRFMHARLGRGEGLIIGAFHHTLADGWSMAVLRAELEALWTSVQRGIVSTLAELDVQYTDLWAARRADEGGSRDRDMAYWREALGGADGAGSWPWPQRKAARSRVRTRRWSDRVDREEAEALQREAARRRATPFLFLAAAFAAFRWRLEGRTVSLIGTDAAGRTDPRAEGLIGFFINVLLLRIETDPRARFADHLDAIRRRFLAAYEHQGADYEEIVRSVAPPRRAGRNPLFNVKLMMHNFPDGQLQVPGVIVAGVPIEFHGSPEDLKVFVRPLASGYELHWEARSDCFADLELRAIAEAFRTVLRQVLACPTIPLRELRLGRVGPSRGAPTDAAPEPAAAPLGALGVAARERGEDVLIDGQQGRWTVGEFSRAIEELAAGLRGLGVGPEVVVGIHLSSSADLLLCSCAVLRAGGAFIVLDPRDAQQDSAASLEVARPVFVIADAAAAELVLDGRVRVLRIEDVRARARGAAAGSEHRPAHDSALVEVCCPDDDDGVLAFRFSGAAFASQLAHWAAVWRSEPGAYVASLAPPDALSLLADLEVCLEQRRTLLLGDLDLDAARRAARRCCYVRVPAVRLANLPPVFASGDAPTNVVVEGRVTPTLCARARGDRPRGRLHLVHRLPGVAVVASHTEWEDTWTELCRTPARSIFGDTTLCVLDAWLHPLPMTGIGEVYASGPIAMALQSAERTACRLVPSPFGSGQRLVRTGLWGVRLPDDQIMLLGTRRLLPRAAGGVCDALRVESALLEHPAVADALVVPAQRAGAGELTAVATPASDTPSETELWAALSARVARSALPDRVMVAPSLPIDARGRIDRRQTARLDARRPVQPEQAPIDADLAALWREVLGLERTPGPGEDFFDLGGDSIMATRLVFRVEERFGIELAVADVFEHRTLDAMSERVRSAIAAAGTAIKLERADSRGLLPVASAQNRLLFLHALNSRESAYHSPAALELSGRPNLPLLVQCLGEIARRQDVLRTLFFDAGGEFRQIVLPRGTVSPACIDLRGVAGPAALGRRLRQAAIRRPFRLTEAPAWRAQIAMVGRRTCELSLVVHHVISDAWSQRTLAHEVGGVAGRYAAGLPSPLAPLAFQYRDYAVWQSRRLQGDHGASLMKAWAALAGDADFEPIRLPAFATARAARRVAYQRFVIPSALQRRLAAVCRARGATLYMLVLAAFQSLLHHASGRETLAVLASTANRYPREMNDVLGFFAHNFPVASRWQAGDSVVTLLDRTRDYLVEALRLQELPFDRIVDAVRRVRPGADPSRVNVSFVMTPAGDPPLALPGVRVRPLPSDDVDPRFDLEMQLSVEENGIGGTLEYATAFLSDEDASACVAQYMEILERTANPASTTRAPHPTAGLRRAVPLAGSGESRPDGGRERLGAAGPAAGAPSIHAPVRARAT